jgi:hypothetical protein
MVPQAGPPSFPPLPGTLARRTLSGSNFLIIFLEILVNGIFNRRPRHWGENWLWIYHRPTFGNAHVSCFGFSLKLSKISQRVNFLLKPFFPTFTIHFVQVLFHYNIISINTWSYGAANPNCFKPKLLFDCFFSFGR